MTGCRGCSRGFRLHRDWTSRWTSLVPAAGEAPFLPLAEAKGSLKVLVVYIRAQDASPTPSTVYETVFTNEVSSKSQFARCSLQSIAAGTDFLGVLEVSVIRKSAVRTRLNCQCRGRLALARIQSVTGDTSITNTRQYADSGPVHCPAGYRQLAIELREVVECPFTMTSGHLLVGDGARNWVRPILLIFVVYVFHVCSRLFFRQFYCR
jgi:hypothetical protein